MGPNLAEEISRYLCDESGDPILVLGPLASALELPAGLENAVLLDPATRHSRILRLLRSARRPLRVLRTHALELPSSQGIAAVLLVIDTLSRFAGDGDEATVIESWSRCLRPGGTLVLVERAPRLMKWPAWLALPGSRRAPLAAEDQTRLLLNAGFGDIRQSWPAGRVITAGRLRPL